MEPDSSQPIASSSQFTTQVPVKSANSTNQRRLHNFPNFDDLGSFRSKASTKSPKIGKREGLRGRYLLKPIESFTYDELIDLLICGCGKVYSTREALLRHIKQCHHDIAPPNTLSKVEEVQSFYFRNQGKKMGGMSRHPLNRQASDDLLLKKDLLNAADCMLLTKYGEQIAGASTDEKLSYPLFLQELKQMGSKPKGQLNPTISISKASVLFLCNISQYVNLQFLLWLEDLMVSLLLFINRHIEPIVEKYQELQQVYVGSCELTSKPKEYKPLVANPANPPPVTKKEGYAATHNCEFLPLVVESYLIKYVQKQYPEKQFELVRTVLEELCSWLYLHQLTRIQLQNYSPENISLLCLADLTR